MGPIKCKEKEGFIQGLFSGNKDKDRITSCRLLHKLQFLLALDSDVISRLGEGESWMPNLTVQKIEKLAGKTCLAAWLVQTGSESKSVTSSLHASHDIEHLQTLVGVK